MGQGPVYLIVGDGRLSRHLQRYFQSLELNFQVWTRTSPLPPSTHVLLAIPDDALEAFVHQHRASDDSRLWLHFSGSLSTPLAWSAHPLMTFTSAPIHDYPGIPFIIEAEGPPWEQLLPGLGNPHHRLERRQKPLYHALCVLSGNFTSILWNHCFQLFEKRLDIPKELAIPYLRAIAANLEQSLDPVSGPLARGDRQTIERNLQALEGDPFHEVYLSFVNAYGVAS